MICDEACAQGIAGHNADYAVFLALPGTFKIQKEIQAILDEGAANCSAEYIPVQFRRFVRLSTPHFRELHEIVISAGIGVSQVLVCRTMKIVGAALCDQRHLCSGGSTFVGAIVRCRDTELLHRI